MTKLQRERARANLRGLRRQLEFVHDETLPIGRRKRASRHAAALAERLGVIRRPDRCEGCGRRLKLERHHHDHFEPLAVTFLCRRCHHVADGMAGMQATA